MSRFGGIPVDIEQPQPSRFGGVPVDDTPVPTPVAAAPAVVAAPPVAQPEPIAAPPVDDSPYNQMALRAQTNAAAFEETLKKSPKQLQADVAAAKASDATQSQTAKADWHALGKEHYDNYGKFQRNWVFRTADRIADAIGGGVEDIALTAGAALHIPGAQSTLDADRKFNEQKRALQDYADIQGSYAAGLASKATAGVGEAALASAVPGGFLAYSTANSLQNHLNQQFEDGSTGWQHPVLATAHAAIDGATVYAGGKLIGAPLEKFAGIGGAADETLTQKASQYVTGQFGLGKAAQLATKIPIESTAQAALGAATTVAHNLAGQAFGEPGASKQDLLEQLREQLPNDLAVGAMAGVSKYFNEVAGQLAKRQQALPETLGALDRVRDVAPKLSPEQVDAAKNAKNAQEFFGATGLKQTSVAFRSIFNAHVDAFSQPTPDTPSPTTQSPDVSQQPANGNISPAQKLANGFTPQPNQPAPEPPTPPTGFGQAGSRATEILNSVKALPQRLIDFASTKPIPNLSRAGVENEAVEHASVPIAVPHVANEMLAKVFPKTYHDPEAMRPTIQALNADNVLGIYDDFVDKQRNAEQAGDDAAADKWAAKADAIGTADEIDTLQKYVESVPDDVKENIGRWNEHVSDPLNKMFHEQLGLDPEAIEIQRGRNFGARINLLDVSREPQFKAIGDEQTIAPPMSKAGGLRNPDIKRDPTARAATGTGEYSTDAEAILHSVLYRRMNETSKLRLYKGMVDKGAAVWGDSPISDEPNAPTHDEQPPEGYSKLEVTAPSPLENGKYPTRNLWVADPDVYRETRRVLNTDLRPTTNPILKGITGAQTGLSIADAVAHLKSVHAVLIGNLKGSGMLDEIARKTPILAQADVVHRLASTALEVQEDTPKIRGELSFLSRNGMLRQESEGGGPMHGLIAKTDTAARIAANRMFQANVDSGAAVDSLENRRQFVNRIGVYNRRLMGETESWMRDKGAAPFIVAGRNMNSAARRMVTGSPGFETTSRGAGVKARATQLLGLSTSALLPAFANAALNHGNPFGPAGTPIGAVGWTDDEGKTQQFDVFQLMGIRRGLRATGLNSVLQSVTEKKSLNEIAGDAFNDIAQTTLHPWQGPAVSMGVATLTGQQFDLRSGPQRIIARNVGGGALQKVENLRAAVKNVLPTAYAATQPLFETVLPKDSDRPGQNLMSGLVKSPLSAIGVRTVNSPAVQFLKNAADLQGVNASTPESGARRNILNALKDNDGSGLVEGIREGVLSNSSAERLVKRSTQSDIISLAKTATVHDALTAYDKATPSERRQLIPVLTTKLNDAFDPKRGVSPDEQKKLSHRMREVGFGR